MKVMFIEAKKKLSENINKINLKKLPKNIFITYSIQYQNLAEQIKQKLGKRIKGFKQVLGCTKLKTKHPILLISDGKFHTLNLILQNNSVYILENNQIKKFPEKEIKKIKTKRKSALLNFLNADTIGIIVSTKPGQNNLKKAIKLKSKLEKQNKNCYLFLADNIAPQELENFPNIQSWLNTACPGLIHDSPKIINMDEICNPYI